ncbi:MAG: 3-dehydroquinate synthase [Glycocaulis sp.]
MTRLHTVPVRLGPASYDVLIGEGALDASLETVRRLCPRGRAIVVADEAALAPHRARLEAALASAGLSLHVIALGGGEAVKSWESLEALTGKLLGLNMERGEALIAFGGGTVGDLAGFAAAIMKRGCPFVQMPTTLLAQVDSSVGGKTGINTRHGKNLVGAFHQPSLVVADSAFLATLPRRELAAGYAEIVKAGLIADAALFERLEALGGDPLTLDTLTPLIADAVAFKARIVAEDEREGGVRALLNLGHTFAHAFEADAKKGTLIHGEAVACGLVMALKYSARKSLCDAGDAQRAARVLERAGLPVTIASLPGGPYDAASLTRRMGSDKKNAGEGLTLILARGIGKAFIARGEQPGDVETFLSGEL